MPGHPPPKIGTLFVPFVVRVALVCGGITGFLALFLFIGRKLELDRRQAHDLEIRTALRAAQLVTAVDIKVIDVHFGIAFRTGSHDKKGPDYSQKTAGPAIYSRLDTPSGIIEHFR